MKEIIICSAIRMKDGYIVRGHRHSDAIRTASGIPRYVDERPHGDDQGFVTSENRYVDRQEAYQIFVDSGVGSVDEASHPILQRNDLYSEDLY